MTLSIFAMLMSSVAGFSQSPGDVVTLKIPLSYLQYEAVRIRDSKKIYSADVLTSGNKVFIGGSEEWLTCCFPSMLEAKVEKVSFDKKTKIAEIEMASGGTVFKIRYAGIAKTFGLLALRDGKNAPEAVEYLDSKYNELGRKIFVGSLSETTDDARREILKSAYSAFSNVAVSAETFKDQNYLALNLGKSETVNNEIQMNQSARVARLISDQMLTFLKTMAKGATGVRGMSGIKLQMSIHHYNFVDYSSFGPDDDLQLYVPLDLIFKFANADITSQQLIDGSFVIVNDNRVSVSLSH